MHDARATTATGKLTALKAEIMLDILGKSATHARAAEAAAKRGSGRHDNEMASRKKSDDALTMHHPHTPPPMHPPPHLTAYNNPVWHLQLRLWPVL